MKKNQRALHLSGIAFLIIGLIVVDLGSSADVLSAESFAQSGIEKHDAPFPGYLYAPKSGQVKGAVLLLHGSGGGNWDYWYEPGDDLECKLGEQSPVPSKARQFAEMGFVSYALCYFDCRHHAAYDRYPPDELVEIDIEIINEALRWLKESALVGGKKTIIKGGSRGAELAALFASLSARPDSGLTQPDGVIVTSGGERVIGGMALEAAQAIINGEPPDFGNFSAWTYRSRPIESGTPIELEQFQGPVLVTYWEYDPLIVESGGGYAGNYLFQYLRYGVPLAELDYFFFRETFVSDDHLSAITMDADTPRVFVEFQGTGHTSPPRGTEARRFFEDVEEKFLNTVAAQK